jgi:TPR repeat protein
MSEVGFMMHKRQGTNCREKVVADERAVCFARGRVLQSRGGYKSAFAEFLKAAAQGHAEAQLETGLCYYEALGTEFSPIKAVEWMERAADRGHAAAECCLAEMIGNGNGVTVETGKSKLYWRRAAEKGAAEAQYITGTYRLTEHRASEQAIAEGANWLRKAAVQGHTEARFSLALHCMEKDPASVDGYAWLSLAARDQHPEAPKLLSSVEKELPSDRLEEGRLGAAEYQKRYARTPDRVPELERLRRQIDVYRHASLLSGLQEEVKRLRREQKKMSRPAIRAVKRLMKQCAQQQAPPE